MQVKQAERQAEGYLELGMAEHAHEALCRHGQQQLSPHGLYLCGEALRSLERYQEALEPLRAAAKATPPSDVHVRLALGWCYKRIGKLPQAISALQQALRPSPDNALLHYNLACYLSLAGHAPQALRHLSRALALEPAFYLMVNDEPDFDPIRDDPTFVALKSTIV